MLAKIEMSPPTKTFCENYLGRKQLNRCVRACDGTTGLGGGWPMMLSDSIRRAVHGQVAHIPECGT